MEKGLSELDMIAEERPLSKEENIKREDCSRSLERGIYLEKVSWRQKSRALWLNEGDNNTLVMDGHRTDETRVIQNHSVNF